MSLFFKTAFLTHITLVAWNSPSLLVATLAGMTFGIYYWMWTHETDW